MRFSAAHAVILLSLTAGGAFAADLPSRKAPPYLPPSRPPIWTGFYVGLNAGGTWSESRALSVASLLGPCFVAFPGCTGVPSYGFTSAVAANFSAPASQNSGFIGGGQIGYNWQFSGAVVAGVEADIQGIAGDRSRSTVSGITPNGLFPTLPLFQAASISKSFDYIGTVRGRIGFLATPTLLAYATGGLAYGGVNSSVGIFQTFAGDSSVTSPFGAGSFSDARVGWTVGGGLEWMFLPNWSAKVEYLYYDLGNVTYSISPLMVDVARVPGNFISSVFPQATARFDGHIARAGVNYHFNWGAPVVANY